MKPNPWALTALLTVTVFSFGVFLNDEGGQLQVIHEILHGESDEQPLQFYAIGEGQLLPVWEENTQSPFVTMVGVGLYYPIKAIDAVVPVLYLLILGWAGALYVTAKSFGDKWYTAERPAGSFVEGLKWRAKHTTFGHRVLFAGTLLATLLLFVGVPKMEYGVWGELVAVQLGHAALFVVAAVWFRDLLAHHFGSEDGDGAFHPNLAAGWLGWAMFMASPLLFWGIGAKYHAMSVFLIVAAMKLWERQDAWRFAALGVAALGAMNTPFGLPLLFGLLILMAPSLWSMRKHPQFKRIAITAGSTFAAALAIIATYNQRTWGRISGRRGPELEELLNPVKFYDWAMTTLRFESWGRSFENLWRVFLDSRTFESAPASLLALTPLMILAFAAPVLMIRRKDRDGQAWLAVLSIVLFFMAFTHALHAPGAGADNRFAMVVLPAFMFLVVYVLKDWIAAAPGRTWSWMGRALGIGFVVSLMILMALAGSGRAVYDPQPALQIRHYAYWWGTVASAATLAAALAPWDKFQVDRWRIQGAIVGLGFVAPLLWLFHTMILFRRSLPSWPFESGNDSVEFVLPHWVSVREWMIQNLLPL